MKIKTSMAPLGVSEKRSAQYKAGHVSFFGSKRLNDNRKETLFAEFHSLLASGIDFNRAFELLIKSEKELFVRGLMENLHQAVVGGIPLWQAFSEGGRFTALDCGVVRIGEETGKLHESLAFLADYYHKRAAQRRMVSAAVSYPAVILAVALVVLVFMVLVIVPMFEQVYTRMGGELPGITRAVIGFSQHFQAYGLGSLVVAGAIVGLAFFNRRSEQWQKICAELLLRFPVAGDLLRKHYQSHFCKLLYLLYSSGVPLLQGVEMLQGILVFYPYRCSFRAIADGLNRGRSFAGEVEAFPKLYDAKLVVLLKVGEETNRLSNMLRKQGEDISAELEHRLRQLGHLLEPALILFVGLLVAVVLISMYLPMFKLGTTLY
ncbi:MAG: type II secretion system F family protein [Rikenellaceae bacterium]|jgi:type IV pilus assembly protein PilC|nr:type II secretion system F family protein [Rikenellaceae bacterium]